MTMQIARQVYKIKTAENNISSVFKYTFTDV